MKYPTATSALAALLFGITGAIQAQADTHFHCFAIAAPRVCQAGPYRVTVQGRDCFHKEITATVRRAGSTLAALSGLQDRVAGTVDADGLAPYVIYTGPEGFWLKVSNGQGLASGTELRLDLPRGDRIDERDVRCNF